MLRLDLFQQSRDILKVLCLGAHSDDIEIGCGGTILRLLAERKHTEVSWVVFGSTSDRAKEALKSAQLFLRFAFRKTVIVKQFRDGFFPFIGAEIKDFFEHLKTETSPDLIFTHYRNDLHQDHRLISDLTWNTFRDNFILEYEVPKYDGDLGTPNCFVHLNKSIFRQKVRYLLAVFQSQRERQWFNRETFRSLMALRAVESNAPEKYAEAFYCRKLVI
jgi:LmbE family N-acetylglucosaminyl deacetylase